jgi:hypothetical protein
VKLTREREREREREKGVCALYQKLLLVYQLEPDLLEEGPA